MPNRTPNPDVILLQGALGATRGSTDRGVINSVTNTIATNPGKRQMLTTWLQKQGLLPSALKSATPNSLALAYLQPNYLKSWRNRINPDWALLGGEDEDDDAEEKDFEFQEKTLPPALALDVKKIEDQVSAEVERKLNLLFREKAANTKLSLGEEAKAQIRALAKEAAEAVAEARSKPQIIEIKNEASGTVTNLGLQHENFPLLLRACQTVDHRGFRLNVWLTGPTGSGKTTAAENVAKALSLPFGSDGSLDADYKVIGYRDGNGKYHEPQFVTLFKAGGIYVADEIDNWLPSALLALNAALANGFIATPDGIVRRHKDFICIACANTWGHGATNEYVGRTKQDAATLDRFQPKIHWPTDEKLEAALAEAQGGAIGKAWHMTVLAARQTAAKQGLKVIISPRATFFGLGMLKAGFAYHEVRNMTILAGLSDDQSRSLTTGQLMSDARQRFVEAMEENYRLIAEEEAKAQAYLQPEPEEPADGEIVSFPLRAGA